MKEGFVCGTFDLFHAGHISLLEDAKSVCDRLLVGIQTDPTLDRSAKHKPIQTIVERQIQVKACRYVDDVIVYETERDLEDLLSVMNINVRILGPDWINQQITGEEICKRRNIEIYYSQRDKRFSSSDLRERIKRG